MIAESFEITAHISKSISYQIESFSSLVLQLSGWICEGERFDPVLDKSYMIDSF